MALNGETDLKKLLSTMMPKILTEEYVFCTIKSGKYGDYQNTSPIACFSEAEGLTLVISQTNADSYCFNYNGVFKAISLTVHSSLQAIGLTAAISRKLASYGISANIIAGYYHDHIFVPIEKQALAMDALQEFSL